MRDMSHIIFLLTKKGCVSAETSMAAVTHQSSSLPVSVAITPNKLDSMNASSYPSYQGSSANLNCMAHLQEKSPSDEQKSLHSSVKEEMFKLCLVLKLTVNYYFLFLSSFFE